jgi:hypothetical protein
VIVPLGAEPFVIVLAGPNGAGKSTFYELFLEGVPAPFVNADRIARSVLRDRPASDYEAARIAEAERRQAGTAFPRRRSRLAIGVRSSTSERRSGSWTTPGFTTIRSPPIAASPRWRAAARCGAPPPCPAGPGGPFRAEAG